MVIIMIIDSQLLCNWNKFEIIYLEDMLKIKKWLEKCHAIWELNLVHKFGIPNIFFGWKWKIH